MNDVNDRPLKETPFSSAAWNEAIDDWLSDLTTRVSARTTLNYKNQIRLLRRWVEAEEISLFDFRARSLSRFLALRVTTGVKDVTRRTDAICCRAFFKWAAKNVTGLTYPFSDYQIPKASKPFVVCPSEADVRQLLLSVQSRWKPGVNPDSRFIFEQGRVFYCRRNYAIIAGLIETGCRPCELLALRLDDYKPKEMQISFRETKGREPRTLPVSAAWTQAVDSYLKKRPKCESKILFVNAYGEPLNTHVFSRQFRGYVEYAGVTPFTLYGLRRYALTRMAETNLLAASMIAGHKDPKTTRSYLFASPEFVREMHAEAGPLTRILVNTRSEKACRRKLI